jgi:hypothetical protein
MDRVTAERALRGAGIDPTRVRVPTLAAGHVPATEGQWRAVLSDAGLNDLWNQLVEARDRVAELAAAAPRTAGREIGRRVAELTSLAESLIANTEGACWFETPTGSLVDHDALARIADAAATIAHNAVVTATGDHDADADARTTGAMVADQIAQEVVRSFADPPSAALAATFAIDRTLVDNLGGLDSGARLQVASGLRHNELNDMSHRILGHLIPEAATYPPSPTNILPAMLLEERPLTAHVVALHLRDLLQETDPTHAAAALDEWRAQIAVHWATHKTMLAGLRRLHEATGDDEEVALAEADLSWAVAEGPVRRLGWTILRLYGAPAAPLPTLSELRDRLIAHGSFLARAVSEAIEPAWRNAVAHRDIAYDATSGKLVLGDGTLEAPGSLRIRRNVGTATISGFECGVALARASNPSLADHLDLAVDAKARPQLARARIADRLAGHDVLCDTINVQDGCAKLTLTGATPFAAAGVLVELAEAREDLGLDGAELRVGDRPPLHVTGHVLAELSRLRLTTRDGSLPTTALWVVIAAGRLDLGIPLDDIYDEVSQRAVTAALQIVAPHFGLDLGEEAFPLTAAASRLDEILRCLLAAWRLLPGAPPQRRADLPHRIRTARVALRNTGELRTAGQRLHELMDREDPPDLPWFEPFGPTVTTT